MTDTQRIAEEVERVLLGEPAHLTPRDVERAAGVPHELGMRLWKSLGFVESADDEVRFTDQDVAALRLTAQLVREHGVDVDVVERMGRALGRACATLAQAETEAMVTLFVRRGAAPDRGGLTDDAVDVLVEQLAPMRDPLEQLLTYAWRRHVAAAAQRVLTGWGGDLLDAPLGVGFADIAGYTRLSRNADQGELDRLLTDFETTAYDVVLGAGGRVVKTVGDEVMWVADTPPRAAEVALALAEAFADSADVDVRLGAAWGPVLRRAGDVFGPPVNVAARATSVARRGTALVDRDLAAALADDARFLLKPIGHQRVRGYANLELSVLRRASAEMAGDTRR